jgi:Uma2 family endonuclease
MSVIAKPKMKPENFMEETRPMAETDIHRDQIYYLIESLKIYFNHLEDVYVSGNNLVYYEQDSERKVFSPDVMICFDVSNKTRHTYKLWEEKVFPQIIFEVSSRLTWSEDLNRKWLLYQQFGVKEYYVFDPEYDYLPEPLVAYRSMNGELRHVPVKNDRIFSDELGLDVVNTGEGLRFFNPATQESLGTLSEERHARLEERNARMAAEAELARVREELKQLKKG